MRPNWALYYCNRGKLYFKLEKKEECLEDLNLAYRFS